MGKKAVLFPGQGAQYVGMGKDLYENSMAARKVYDLADEVLGFELSSYIFAGEEDDLQKTEITQPAILATSIAAYELVKEQGIIPEAAAGFSLGEYSALVVAEALSLEESLPLVQKRGRYMQEAVPLGRGGMAAVIGLAKDQVEEACRQTQKWGTVEPANYNCPGQIVVSGEREAVHRVMEKVKEMGAKRVIELKVSAPFHCSLLQPVEEKMSRELARISLKPAKIPIVANYNAALLQKPEEIKEALIKQVSHPIKWDECTQNLLCRDFDFFLEVGPGKVLTGFVKKISRQAMVVPAGDLEAIAHAAQVADSQE